MNRQLFYQYLQNPQQLSEESLKHINELVSEYPFFQIGRMLLVKNMAITSHIKYNVELKISAAHIPDRRKLFFLINPPIEQIVSKKTIEAISEEVKQAIPEPITIIPKEEELTPQIVVDENLEIIAENKLTPNENYFDVSDVIELDNGELMDFSTVNNTITEQEILPTADLLDYEMAQTNPYQLTESPSQSFDIQTKHPFSEWLKAMSEPLPPSKEIIKKSAPIDKQMQIIENFLQKGRDRITPDKNTQQPDNKDIAEKSTQESDALMTETLANIHIKQKQYQKAITTFEKLILKYPEKSIYFATRISETERLITNS
jgi:tetratricopeptide (TPR) repeat protein